MVQVRPNILLIGCGPHAQRVYLPALKASEKEFNTQIKVVVEIKEKCKETLRIIENFYPKAECLFIEQFSTFQWHTLPHYVEKQLNLNVEKYKINAVIIATDPMNHMQYALWAVNKNLHIFMDKPISSYSNVSNSVKQAKQIKKDFSLLLENYSTDKAFILNAQRRFLPQLEIIQGKINEVAGMYGTPITSMQSSHSDGQWRLPNEIIDLKYHGYHGNGKVSHSGFHFIDLACKLTKESFEAAEKSFNNLLIYSSFIRPSGVLKMQGQADLLKIFGNEYKKIDKRLDEEILQEFAKIKEGEVDVAAIITILKNNIPLSNITLNLIHNGFSRRHWMKPNMQDLYKGNGRVRHEYHNIQQGALQNIQVHSYQSNDNHNVNTVADSEIGGNNHYDIYIYRNKEIIGGEQLEIITNKDIIKQYSLDSSKVTNEIARYIAVNEFLEVVTGNRLAQDTRGNITDYGLSAQVMSMICESGIKKSEIIQSYSGFHSRNKL